MVEIDIKQTVMVEPAVPETLCPGRVRRRPKAATPGGGCCNTSSHLYLSMVFSIQCANRKKGGKDNEREDEKELPGLAGRP
ncbi:hypothetical protein [Desulfatitalea alkaliphila]|uniref:Uncharacterized protein n=1 Tax=Desulfatitalea alkaliphila TaxID=2929485 RepID=A0AA41R4S6_9BACT|nr:hypothetical protein [Desulfatitalea alkaliphila]MCJ8501636.1 hypothetical protein [Desulfatitalea alkaliphila]